MNMKSKTKKCRELRISETYVLTLEVGEVISLYVDEKDRFVSFDYMGWNKKTDPADLNPNPTDLNQKDLSIEFLQTSGTLIRNVILIDRFQRKGFFLGPIWIGIFIDCETCRYFYENSRSIYRLAVQNAK